MMAAERIPLRSEIRAEDKWDLSSLFVSEEEWTAGLEKLKGMIPVLGSFRGTLGKSAAALAECLDFVSGYELLAERLGSYAMLMFSGDGGDPENQKRYGLYISAAVEGEACLSYLVPEIQAVDDKKIEELQNLKKELTGQLIICPSF